MNKYKWCVCDMDGTLLNSQNIITEENEAALKKLHKEGLEVIIATGRTDLMVKTYIKQLELTGYCISSNGGLIRNIKTGEVLYSKLIEKSAVREVLDYCIKENVDFLVYSFDMVYGNKGNPVMLKYERYNKEFPENLQVPLEYVDDMEEVIEKNDILKILLYANERERILQLEKHFSKNDKLSVVSSAELLLDIMAPNVTKGSALKVLAKKAGVDLEEVIAFGDNYNDIEMLECVGMPIAVGNAVDAVKQIAKQVTKSNNESGIAYAINNFISLKDDI